jgi:hypothetical protein
MMKFGSIFTRIKFHIMNYTIEDIPALAVNLVLELSKKAKIPGPEDGGGKLILIKNVVCIGKKVNNYYWHLV